MFRSAKATEFLYRFLFPIETVKALLFLCPTAKATALPFQCPTVRAMVSLCLFLIVKVTVKLFRCRLGSVSSRQKLLRRELCCRCARRLSSLR